MSADTEDGAPLLDRERLLEAAATISSVMRAFEHIPEADAQLALGVSDAVLRLAYAQSYLIEFRCHLDSGKNIREALLATARGDLQFG